jgi:hypothetical protein
LLAGGAFAVLPPDAAFRAPQIHAEYMRSARAYEERQQQRQREAIEQYRKTEADIFTPPWKRAAAPSAAAISGGTSAPAQKAVAGQPGRKWTFSIIALLLIGGAVWWVRTATEPE